MLRLRSGPQDLPAAAGLAFVLGAAYALQGMVTDRALDGADAAPRSLLAIAVQLGAISALLGSRRQAARIPQTISALSGTGTIFGLLAYALLSQAQAGQPQPGLATTYLKAVFG